MRFPRGSELLIRRASGERGYLAIDPVLGWTIAPNAFLGPYCADELGRRDLGAASSSLTVGAFGDSFTHGDHVEGWQTWTALLQERGRFQVENYGVPGYGLDQSFLRYREREPCSSFDVVLIGLMSENPYRHVNAFRPFYVEDELSFSKPRFVVSREGLELLPNQLRTPLDYAGILEDPVGRLAMVGEHDQFFQLRPHHRRWDAICTIRLLKTVIARLAEQRPLCRIRDSAGTLDPTSNAFAITARLLETFSRLAAAHGSRSLVLVFPTIEDVRTHRRTGASPYSPLTSWMDERAVPYLDLLPTLAAQDPTRLYLPHDAHLSPRGHALVASAVDGRLKETTVSSGSSGR